MAHLLVVDDERSISELLEISFRKDGHKVELASNGEDAKRRLAAEYSTSWFQISACPIWTAWSFCATAKRFRLQQHSFSSPACPPSTPPLTP